MNQFFRALTGSLAVFAWVLVSGCGNGQQAPESGGEAAAPATGQELVVYSHRHYPADKQLFERFEQETGIKISVVNAKADELIKRLEIEGDESPADLLITVDAGRMAVAKQKGLLQAAESAKLQELVPENLRDGDMHWVGLTVRARVVAYAKERVKEPLIKTYADLADPKVRGKVLIRSSSNVYNRSLIASIIANEGAEAAEAWAKGVVANMARTPKGNDRDQMKAVVAGIGDYAVVNTYYLGLLLNSDNEEERKVGESLGLIFPDQDGRGAHINVSGAGLTKSCDQKEAAIKLLEFLAADEAQKVFAEANYEYPVRESLKASELLQSWGAFKRDTLNLAVLGEKNAEATKVFDAAGWR
jgi:iron(III) transport system substrate-binding protein